MALPSTGLSMSMVEREVGTYTNYLSSLCLSPNINPASKYKPVDFPTTSGITETQRKTTNYGLGLTSTNTNLYSNNLADLYNIATTTNDYYYHRPKGGSSSPYRLGDYRQYNHNALWFWENGEPVNQSGDTGTYSNTMIVNSDADILPTDLNDFNDHSSDWHYCMITRKQGYNNYDLFVGEPLFIDGDLNTQNASAEVTFSSSGAYETFLTISKATSTGETLPHYFVRDSYKTYYYDPSFAPFDFAVNYDYDPIFASTTNGDYCSSFSYRFDLLNVGTGVTNFELSIRIKDSSSDLWTSTWSAATPTDTLITGTMNCNFYMGPDGELDIYQVYAVVSYEYNGTPKTRYFDFANETISSTTQYESGADFFEQYCMSHS